MSIESQQIDQPPGYASMASQNQKTTYGWKSPVIVENVHIFRRVQLPNDVCILPEIPQKRKNTDVAFLITFGICIVILLALMIYALVNSDMQRFIHGYDRCGNVCGSKNTPVDGVLCSGQDMTEKPILLYEYNSFSGDYVGINCINSCLPPFKETFHRCAETDAELDFFTNILEKLNNEGVGLTVLACVGLGLSICLLLAFRYFVKEFVWTMLILFILAIFGATVYVWYLYGSSNSEESSNSLLYFGIVLTIVLIVVVLFILILTIKIKLIIYFFEEAVRIVFSMPTILLEPVLTFVSNFIVMALFLYTLLLMASSGNLQKDENEPGRYKYVPNGVVLFILCWSFIITIWMLQFILACQHMVIAGAVATYYFAKDKLAVVAPVYGSFYNLVRYHLGTVAYGSLLFIAINILKLTVNTLAKENAFWKICYYCFSRLADILKYMSSMGYIETAIHGQPLCRSSMRAVNLIVHNLLSAIALNNLGSFVFFMTKLVVVVAVVVIGICIDLSSVTMVFGGIIAFMCVHCFFVVFESSVDTIFICYCEDNCLNDGDTNAYYATVELHNQIKKTQAMTRLIEEAKLKKKNKK